MLTEKAEDLKEFFLGISNPGVKRILDHIADNPGQTQSKIVLALNLHQPSFSRWIGIAKKLNLVTEEKNGVPKSYTINESNIHNLNNKIEELLKYTDLVGFTNDES